MKTKLLISTFLISLSLFGQNSTSRKYASFINEEDLKTHLYVLASDSLEGRETGKKGQKLAADYISKHFKSVGIPPYNGESYYQEFPLLSQKTTSSSLIINKELKYLEEYYIQPFFGSSSNTFSELYCVGYGRNDELYSDFHFVDVKDKAVLIFESNIDEKKNIELHWKEQLENAYNFGAKAVVFVGKNIKEKLKKYPHYFSKQKQSVFIDEAQFKIPFVFIDEIDLEQCVGLSRKRILKKIDKNKYPSFNIPVQLETTVKSNMLQGENVLGYLEGTDLKEELLVITAHYDHIGEHDGEIHNGADDDGSGVVAILEMAEAFAKAKEEGHGPRRSVLFMPVAGEEMGLLGSSYYTENPIFPLQNTIADLNIDMIGRMDEKHKGNPDYVYLIGSDKLSTELHQISEEINRDYTQLELDYTFNEPNDPNRFYYRSDHYNFAKNNIPVIFYFNGVHKDYHKPTDTVEKIHFGKIEKISKLIFHTAWQLLNQDKRIEVDVENEFKNTRK